MYIEKKKIHGKEYYYLKSSHRKGGKVMTSTLAYLGKFPLTQKQLQQKMDDYQQKLQQKMDDYRYNIQQEFLTSSQIEKIQEIKKDFRKKLQTLDYQLVADMFKDFKTYYIYNTNAIEGNTHTLEETSRLLNEYRTSEGKDLREIYDHINEKETFDRLLKEKPEIDEGLVIDIHKHLLHKIDQRTGNFRRHNVRVFGADLETSEAKYVLTDMKILLKWYGENKKKFHPLVLSAIFHEKFEKIHLFYDGNGRTGRMLLNLMLMRAGIPPLVIKNKTKNKYYEALNEGHKASLTEVNMNYKPIVQFCFEQAIQTYKEIFSKW